MNKGMLFWASNVALIAVAMSFAIRGDIMGDFETQFVKPYVEAGHAAAVQEGEPSFIDKLMGIDKESDPVKRNLGIIAGVAFLSFALVIIFGGPLVDFLGMGNLLRVAALCHIGGSILTIFAPSFWYVVLATFVVGMGNGLVEAVCNPLIAALYPEEKIYRLTRFHAWFPGGLVIGSLLAYGFSQIGLPWQAKMALILIPSVIYTVMIFGQKFPKTERVASGLPFSAMVKEALARPLFLLLFGVMWLTAAAELGTGQWISNIYRDVFGGKEGVLALAWGSILMYIQRDFLSKYVNKLLSPVALMAVTAPIAAAGLFMFGYATTRPMFFAAATLVYVGVCFWWPTMLGIANERCPKTGALGMALLGGAGNFATFIAGPVIGGINDRFGPGQALQVWAILPVGIMVVFLAIYLVDRSRGGYKAEKLEAAGH
ncbi:MAG: MFS transporter [Candidatus Hydrogenedentes bacterium]|nr:MFS transporter [Candidatus Hydrogenedentota bacterium]